MVPAMLLGLAACAKAPSQQPTEAQTVATEPETTVSATDSLFENMTLEEKVGQLFYMCYPDANYADTIKQYHLGGLVLGKRFGTRLAGRAGIMGGAILILIGLEIFITGVCNI